METEGFRVFMEKAAPLYKPPSRNALTILMEKKYENLSAIIKREIQTISDICLTTDVWTDTINTQSYLGLTAHYLTEDGHKTITIGVRELDDNHTSENLEEWLNVMMKDWGITHDAVVAVVSDSAANIKKALTDGFTTERHLPCFAHLLNLVPTRILEKDDEIRELCHNVKGIATFFQKIGGGSGSIEIGFEFEINSKRRDQVEFHLCNVGKICRFSESSRSNSFEYSHSSSNVDSNSATSS